MIDPRLISDARDALARDTVPASERMAVRAAIRQAMEFPALARESDAVGVLLKAVGFNLPEVMR